MITRLFTLPLRMLVVAAALPMPSALGATPAGAAPVPAYASIAESGTALAAGPIALFGPPEIQTIRSIVEP